MKHVMVDLETMGTSVNSAIVSIGACKFNEKGICDTFYSKISLKSCMNAGMNVDPDTIIWWLQQSDQARKELVDGKDEILTSLLMFSNWFKGSEFLWGNGAAFDNVILGNAFDVFNLDKPWKFWNDRCYRTVKAMSDIPFNRVGTYHNALDDAKTQTEHLIAIWNNSK